MRRNEDGHRGYNTSLVGSVEEGGLRTWSRRLERE